jgi:hypothetical protein
MIVAALLLFNFQSYHNLDYPYYEREHLVHYYKRAKFFFSLPMDEVFLLIMSIVDLYLGEMFSSKIGLSSMFKDCDIQVVVSPSCS